MTTENENPQAVAAKTSSKKKIAIGVAAAVVIAGGFAFSSGSDAMAEKKVAAFVERAETKADGDVKIAYGDVSASMSAGSVAVDDVRLSEKDGNEVVEIGNVEVTAKGYVENEKLPYLASFSVSDMRILDERMLSELKSESGMDYSGKDIDVSFGYEFEESSDSMSAQAKLGVSDINEISFKAKVSGVNEAWALVQETYKANKGSMDFSQQQGREVGHKLQSAKFNSLSLTYENDGEIETLMTHAAEKNGITLEEFKQQIPNAVDHYIGDQNVAGELKKFLADPESITLSIEPDSAIPFAELPMVVMAGMMGQTEQVIQKLNIKVSAN